MADNCQTPSHTELHKISHETEPQKIPTKKLSAEEIYEYLQVFPNPDGTLTRSQTKYPNTSPTPNPDDTDQTLQVLSKDIILNPTKNTRCRIFLPKHVARGQSNVKLPLIVYCHGGGFISMSEASTLFHDFLVKLAYGLNAVIVSVGYRLAPDHRLPAAYEDTVEAINWVKSTDEVWLRRYADYNNFFLVGSSAGGNIAYNAGLLLADQTPQDSDDDNQGLKIKGLILHQPMFGGVKITDSEERIVSDPFLPPGVADFMWSLALPVNADRDHEYCNPTVGGGSQLLDKIKALGWKVLVTCVSEDPLIDKQIDFVKMMEAKGLNLEVDFREGGPHGVEFLDQSKFEVFLNVLNNFMSS